MEYLHLESDTAGGNSEARIMKLIVTTSTTIYAPHRDKVFVTLSLKMNVTVTLSNSHACYTLQNTALYSPTLHFQQYIVVHFFSFRSTTLASVCTHSTWQLKYSLQLVCVPGILYKKWSLPTNLPTELPVWPCTWIPVLALISNPSVNLSYKIASKIFFLFWRAWCVYWQMTE
jgi:hypothetical protein